MTKLVQKPASNDAPNGVSGPVRDSAVSRWLLKWHLPPSLRRGIPQPFAVWLRRTRAELVSGRLPRDQDFSLTPEDVSASAAMSVVIPIHDAPAVTRRCLASLERYAPEAEIILVDDASRLSETSQIISDFGNRRGWRIVRHEKSQGHSRACEAGARFATRPYLCLLNSDTVVTPWVWRLVKSAFQQDPAIGVAGPSTSSSGNEQRLETASTLCTYWSDDQICAFAQTLLHGSHQPALCDLPWASGFALFIKIDLWRELGGFDLSLPDYGNERELCLRVAQRGHRIVWVRNAYIHHFGQQSYGTQIGMKGIRARCRNAMSYIGLKTRSGTGAC